MSGAMNVSVSLSITVASRLVPGVVVLRVAASGATRLRRPPAKPLCQPNTSIYRWSVTQLLAVSERKEPQRHVEHAPVR